MKLSVSMMLLCKSSSLSLSSFLVSIEGADVMQGVVEEEEVASEASFTCRPQIVATVPEAITAHSEQDAGG